VINIPQKQNNIGNNLLGIAILVWIATNGILLAISLTGLNFKFFKYVFPGINF
jgi:hypothetical protein